MKKIIIMAGQSNMAGRGSMSELPKHLQVPDTTVEYHYALGFAREQQDPDMSAGWVPLQPGPDFPSTNGRQFGPELTFAEELKLKYTSSFNIIKVAIGGTSLAIDWNPDAQSGQRLYKLLRRRILEGIDELKDSGEEIEIAGVLWMQGEGDAIREDFAHAYGENLKCFIERLRNDFKIPELPFILGQIMNRTNPQMKWAKAVREAQAQVAETIPQVQMVLTDDLPDLGDGTHFNSEGLMKLGRRFARKFLNHPS